MYKYECVCTYVCIYILMHVYTYACMCKCTVFVVEKSDYPPAIHLRRCNITDTHTHTLTHTQRERERERERQLYAHTHTYTHIHIHTHTVLIVGDVNATTPPAISPRHRFLKVSALVYLQHTGTIRECF
jgi:hypothetical protein